MPHSARVTPHSLARQPHCQPDTTFRLFSFVGVAAPVVSACASWTSVTSCSRVALAMSTQAAGDSGVATRLATAAEPAPLPAPENPESIFDFTVNGIHEATVPLSRYRGRVCMYVRWPRA